MRNAGLEEAQAGIKIAGRNINSLRYADDTTLMAESEEELKSLLMKVKVCVSVKSLSRVRLFATPWITAHQGSLSITNSQSSLRLMSIGSVMPSSHLILSRPLLLLPPIPPASESFPMGQLFVWGGQSTGASALASFLPKKLSTIRVVSSAYLRLLIFLLVILIPGYASSSPAFLMMYSAYKLWCILNIS